ncbi:MAG TPA: tetratricopeptide repeat protein [Thermoanaerobaculia bacterium]|nr:tetratricopeptide repeat protein [Thermoanaerobaculia bacterium]
MVFDIQHPIPKALAPALLLALGSGLTACSQYQPFDTESYLKTQLQQKVVSDRLGELRVPFALDNEIRRLLETHYKPAPSERRRVEDVLDFIFGRLKLQYALTPTRDAVGTYQAKSGNCLSFVNLFVGVARHQRLNPFYVEVTDYQRWNYREGFVVSRGHIVAGMYVSGELKTYDFLPYRAKAYRDFKPIDDTTAAAHFYNNLGAEALLDGDLETASRNLEIAHQVAPNFLKGLNNLGVIYARTGRIDDALTLYHTGLEQDPEDVALLTNLARAYQQLGRLDDAQATLAKVAGINTTNPFFFVYQAELALARSQPAEALKFLAEALRRDTEVPEVHVALAKTYLALGDLEKARHHLDRALHLDATNRDALRLAGLLGQEIPPGVRPSLDVVTPP